MYEICIFKIALTIRVENKTEIFIKHFSFKITSQQSVTSHTARTSYAVWVFFIKVLNHSVHSNNNPVYCVYEIDRIYIFYICFNYIR